LKLYNLTFYKLIAINAKINFLKIFIYSKFNWFDKKNKYLNKTINTIKMCDKYQKQLYLSLTKYWLQLLFILLVNISRVT